MQTSVNKSLFQAGELLFYLFCTVSCILPINMCHWDCNRTVQCNKMLLPHTVSWHWQVQLVSICPH